MSRGANVSYLPSFRRSRCSSSLPNTTFPYSAWTRAASAAGAAAADVGDLLAAAPALLESFAFHENALLALVVGEEERGGIVGNLERAMAEVAQVTAKLEQSEMVGR